MSEVEIYWNAIAAKAGDRRTWYELQLIEQQMIVQSINLLLDVLRNGGSSR